MSLGVAALHIDEPSAGRVKLQVKLANGREHTLFAATPRATAGWVAEAGVYWGVPHLYVRELDDDVVRGGVEAMAKDLSGYWLSYCARAARERPEEAPSPGSGPPSPGSGPPSPGSGPPKPLKVPLVELGEREPAGSGKQHGAGVVRATLTDGREFSILACTPSWFAEAFDEAGLSYYWGPSMLFLAKLDKSLAKRAVDEMAKLGDRWLCFYDTPRATLAKVIADFKARTA